VTPAVAPINGLTPDDYGNLAKRWLRVEDAAAAGLYRVDGVKAQEITGRRAGRPGVVIPYCDPGNGAVVLHRIRIDDEARPAELGADETRPKVRGSGWK